MAEFSIKVQELDAGGKEYDFPIRREWLDSVLAPGAREGDRLVGDPEKGEGHARLWAEKSGEDVVVRGRIRTNLVAECSRCLGEAHLPVDTELTALFMSRSDGRRPVADEDELTPDEIDTEFYSGEHVVLDTLVRENILLEVPMQPLCSESCTGIEIPASIKGADWEGESSPEVDPRFAVLADLAEAEKKKSSH